MEEKYLTLLDDETRAFIRHTEAFYPADAVSASVETQRAYYDALCREYDPGYPPAVTASDRALETANVVIPGRDYVCNNQSNKAHIVYFHGGGFVVGGLESHDSICAELCAGTGLGLTAVDYRLAPEHLHPAAFDDALAAFESIAKETDRPILLMGDSAGGNLAAAVSHIARKNAHQPIGQVLIYPALGGDMSIGAYVEHANAPMLTTADIHYYHDIRMPKGTSADDVSVNPLSDPDFSGLPPTIIFSAECDPLADDGMHYRDRMLVAGGKAHWINETGMVHGYLRARTTVRRAAESFTRIVEAAAMLSDGRWDYDQPLKQLHI